MKKENLIEKLEQTGQALESPYRSPMAVVEKLTPYVRGKKFCELGGACGDIIFQFKNIASEICCVERDLDYLEVLNYRNIPTLEGDVLNLKTELKRFEVFYFWFNRDNNN